MEPNDTLSQVSHHGAGDEAHHIRRIQQALSDAARFLSPQAPIRRFVHNNILMAYEDLPFEEAVVTAAQQFGAQPYAAEKIYAGHVASGRIRSADIYAVLRDMEVDDHDPVIPHGPTRYSLRAWRLQHLFEVPQGHALDWLLHESDLLFKCHPLVSPEARERLLASADRADQPIQPDGADPQRSKKKALPYALHPASREARMLHRLWEQFYAQAPIVPSHPIGVRPRDILLALTNRDTDLWVHPLLIRFCAAFMDQGVAYWPMPGREHGFLNTFRALYGQHGSPPDPWMATLAHDLRQQHHAQWSAEHTVHAMLRDLGIPEAEWPHFIKATILSLPGWAGMIRQMECHPDMAPVHAPPPTTLMDFLAVRLILEKHACTFVMRTVLRKRGHLGQLRHDKPTACLQRDLSVAYEAFVMAQVTAMGPAELNTPAAAQRWLHEVIAFNSVERRRLLHLAFERHHRVRLLDALLAHARLGNSRITKPRLQAIFCLDDREESLRRHLEEIDPTIETFGHAGFYGVAMVYKGLTDIRSRPLCPPLVQAHHKVYEEAIQSENHAAHVNAQRSMGALQRFIGVSSQTLVRGGLLASGAGLLYMFPLIGRTLFPRASQRVMQHMRHRIQKPPATRLVYERPAGCTAPDADGLWQGYSVDEMANVVASAMNNLGVKDDFAPLIIVSGHHSSSLNNPHESTYDCAATASGQSGPNARAFALMANRPDVRAILQSRGITIPDTTWFLAGSHNTCDESMIYYDLDAMPAHVLPSFQHWQTTLAQAVGRDAQERCRRFESVPLSVTPKAALAYTEGRSTDLAQPRPELGHATVAFCIIGRRERSRGLFMDRRSFLVSYDPNTDPSGTVLANLLEGPGPVGAGASLDYYFSYIDRERYGSSSKLPHNIVGLIGVMDGHASDLRTGLPWQAVELHEPMRLLNIVEAEPEVIANVLPSKPTISRLVRNGWVHVVAWSPSTGMMHLYTPDKGFVPYTPESIHIPIAATSLDHFRGHREHLQYARIDAGLNTMEAPSP